MSFIDLIGALLPMLSDPTNIETVRLQWMHLKTRFGFGHPDQH